MKPNDLAPEARQAVDDCLGYLNFSSGSPDAKFLGNLNKLFALFEGRKNTIAWSALGRLLRQGLRELQATSETFHQAEQAQSVLSLVFDHALKAYAEHHRDLLSHRSEASLFRPYFIGRMCEAVLEQGGPWQETERIVAGALIAVNDYIGYRPVAVLRSEQKIQPYAHEWVRPLPLYIRGAGAECGRYRALVEKSLEILAAAPSDLLFQAYFEPSALDELAVDPRAYDFDHPNHKRPNYLFGQWDWGRLNSSGRCTRFVIQSLTLETMMEWAQRHKGAAAEEALYEAAAVLAGTMLMGSGISGDRPNAHDSTVTLSGLVQRIAVYRDAFYERLLDRVGGEHGDRLRDEAAQLRQPFGGVRQFFNQRIAQRRAEQLKHAGLAYVYTRMGHIAAAAAEIRAVPVTAARMQCDIYCRLNTAYRLIEQNKLEEAIELLPEVDDLLRRAIGCGAIVDPWNILGFGGQYSLFPSPENSVHDHRIDALTDTMGAIFATYAALEKEAAANGKEALRQQADAMFELLAGWWDKFASVEVGEVDRISGREAHDSTNHVAGALGAWHRAATAAGDVAFWREHAEQFRTPKAYAMVVRALLEQRDPIAAMALLIQWLSQHGEIPLADEEYSFYDLTLSWLAELWRPTIGNQPAGAERTVAEKWALSRKFIDYLEANAESLWQAPEFELGDPSARDADEPPEEEPAEEWDSVFGAAYEDVTFRDSGDDGIEGETFESGPTTTDIELASEGERIVGRLLFLATAARLWRMTAMASLPDADTLPDRDETLAAWHEQAALNVQRLSDLLATVNRYRIPPPRGTHESLLEYDRRRTLKEMLLEEIINASVESNDAARMLRAAMRRPVAAPQADGWEGAMVGVLNGVLRRDIDAVHAGWRELTDTLARVPLLYVSLAHGGNPQRVVDSRGMQRVLQRLLAYLPRLGLLRESFRLLETIQDMEFNHPVGPGAITEFDLIFEIGCRAIIRCLVESAATWRKPRGGRATKADLQLIALIESLIDQLLNNWLDHSQGVRLSVLEVVADPDRWRLLKKFIRRYGADLFTQQFMSLGNLRAILHQGVDAWLESLEEVPETAENLRLLVDLDTRLPRREATRYLSLAIEAVVENYQVYIDYNTITTQSDRGDMLYTLLDFLRLAASYDRVDWNLRPIGFAHNELVRRGRPEAASLWRQAVTHRTGPIADEHLSRYEHLVRKYGMRLPSVAERLGERFVRPLAIDCLCALVRPAIDELNRGVDGEAFARLQEEINRFSTEIVGSGIDVPTWLEALTQEVDNVREPDDDEVASLDPLLTFPQLPVTLTVARAQINAIVRGK